jgi:2-hydroxy-6-oxonona-2,4-dienedioate hydrolase
VDRPGYGLSASVDYRTVEPRAFSVGVLTGLLDTLGIDSLSVVGSSFGGTIAFWLASDHPERVESLLQLGLPSFVPGMAVPSWMRLLSVRGLNRLATGMQTPSTPQSISMLRNVGHGTTLDAGRIPVEFLELYAAYERLPWFGDTLTELEALVRFRGVRPRYAFTENSLGEVTQPTLLVCGEDDPFGGQVVAERTAAVLDDALLEVIENGGHLPWLDRQTLCSRLVMGFLTDHGTVPLSIEVERT